MQGVEVRHQRKNDVKLLDLVLDKVTLIVGGRNLLENTKLKLTFGHKYGLIGRNGIGKTCLMNALACGEFDKIPDHIQILLVEQEVREID